MSRLAKKGDVDAVEYVGWARGEDVDRVGEVDGFGAPA
jgi:hypothetical protein